MKSEEKQEDFITTFDKEKIPKTKQNFKELLYKKRIQYGKYIKMGLVCDNLKFRIKNNNIEYLLDEKNINKNNNNNNDRLNENLDNEKDLTLDEKLLKSLFYYSEFDFSIMPSKREIRLHKLLEDKINKFIEIKTKLEGNKK